MPRVLASALRATTRITIVVVLLWVLLIAAPMGVTRWHMARLLADYHSIYPTQTTWPDAQKLMARWGRWGHYEGACSSTECDYSICVEDVYSGWIEKLSNRNQLRIFNSHVITWANRLGYRPGTMTVRFQVLDGKLVRTYSSMMLDVEDAGPPEHYQYPLAVTAQSRSNLSKYTRPANDESGVYGWGAQLDLHPDYQVSRPSACEVCMVDRIAYTFTLPHETMVRLTSYNLGCLTQWHACTTVGDLLPFGSEWRLWDAGQSNLYPGPGKEPLPCRTELRALARDAATVLEVEPLATLPPIKQYGDAPPRELVRVRILHTWKDPLSDTAGSTIQVSPYEGRSADEHFAAMLPEHLLPGHRALLFLPESAAADLSVDEPHGTMAYRLDRCGVMEDTPANLAAIPLGIAQDIPYRHPLQNLHW